jgi:hypothetical protein
MLESEEVLRMSDRKLKILFGILSVVLLTSLLYKLTAVPGGIILSGLVLGGMFIAGIVIICLILSGLLMFLFKEFCSPNHYFISNK